MGRQKVFLDKLSRTLQIRNKLLRQGLAECLGTLILVVSVKTFRYSKSRHIHTFTIALTF